ncbi:MAG: hypothetical protein ACLRQF_00810 [Thomasclavelia ramosa]
MIRYLEFVIWDCSGNAKEALKIADEVTDDIKDDGIYNSMKNMV